MSWLGLARLPTIHFTEPSSKFVTQHPCIIDPPDMSCWLNPNWMQLPLLCEKSGAIHTPNASGSYSR